MNLTYKVFLICFFSITLGYSQNLIFEGLPIINKKESLRFLKTVQNLKELKSGQLNRLNIQVKRSQIKKNLKKGIF